MQYGIGTYISELVQSLLTHSTLTIFVVSYMNSEHKELTVRQTADRYTELFVPVPATGRRNNLSFEDRYASVVVKLLSPFVPGSGKVIFQMNYIDDLAIAKAIRLKYDHPVISIVHFAQFQQLFFGNRLKLKGLNIDKPSDNIEFTLSKEKEFYNVSDHIVSVTSYMKEFLANEFKIPESKISVVRNGIDQKGFSNKIESGRKLTRKQLGIREEDIIILFSGRIDTCKGADALIDAFGSVCLKNSDLLLVMLGQGNISECQKRLQSSFGRVIYTGFVSRDLVASFYAVADIGIVPSVYDHCPYTVLEMMAAGIPLIASRINGLDEILDDSCCLFVDPVISSGGDISISPEALALVIERMAAESGMRSKLSENAYRRFTGNFKSERMAIEMIHIYNSITNRVNLKQNYETVEGR
jgi:glycosyltransferase involved in cell wall biosynthesis